jgi:uncharacterized protein YkwD
VGGRRVGPCVRLYLETMGRLLGSGGPRAVLARSEKRELVAALATACVLAGFMPASAGAACPDTELAPTPETLARVEAALACLMNEARRSEELVPLRVGRRLERSSAAHTHDMITEHYFAHHRAGRPTLVRRIARTGFFQGAYTGLYAENLGYAPPERAHAASMHRAFMLSPAHRDNVLYRRFRRVGIGTAMTGPDPVFYPDYPSVVFTIDFGRRYVRKRRRSRQCLERSGAPEGDRTRRAVRPRWICPRRRRS